MYAPCLGKLGGISMVVALVKLYITLFIFIAGGRTAHKGQPFCLAAKLQNARKHDGNLSR